MDEEALAPAGEPGIPVSSGDGLVQVLTPDEVTDRELRAQQAKAPPKPKIDSCVQLANDIFRRNADFRRTSGVEEEMLSALRQRAGTYDSAKLAAIQAAGGSEVFLTLTTVKCRHAEAIIRDVFVANQEPWAFEPTPQPMLPADVREAMVTTVLLEFASQLQANAHPMTPESAYQYTARLRQDAADQIHREAKMRAARMQHVVADQLVEGKWNEAFDDFITNLVTLKAGIVKGAVLRERDELQWGKRGGQTVPVVVKRLKLEWESANPLDVYPHEGAVDCQNGDFVHRVRFHPVSLLRMRDVPGYYAAAINSAVSDYGTVGYHYSESMDVERADLEKRLGTLGATRGTMEALDVWTQVSGSELKLRGVTKDPEGKAIEAGEYYDVNMTVCGQYLLQLTVNADPLRRRPFYKTVYEKIPGSFWGKGVPELMKDLQGIVNASVRSVVNNMGSSATYQTMINDISRLAPGEDPTLPLPARVWQFLNPGNSSLKPVEFFQPESRAAELLAVMREFVKMADDYTGIPAYAYGSDEVAGAGRTSSGLAMLMDNAARGIKNVMARIDMYVVSPCIESLYQWNMIYNPDEDIKGDVVVVPKGVLAQIMREQMSQRRLAFLNTTNNPTDAQIMGLEGRAVVIRAEAANCELDVNDVVRKKEVLEKIDEMARQLQASQMVQKKMAGAGAPA